MPQPMAPDGGASPVPPCDMAPMGAPQQNADVPAPMPEGGEEQMPEEDVPQNEKAQEVAEIMDGLNDDGQETILKYARSVKDEKGGAKDGEEMSDMPQQEPMQESVIFTKKQLKHINENIGNLDAEKNDGVKTTTKIARKKNIRPIDPPKSK